MNMHTLSFSLEVYIIFLVNSIDFDIFINQIYIPPNLLYNLTLNWFVLSIQIIYTVKYFLQNTYVSLLSAKTHVYCWQE